MLYALREYHLHLAFEEQDTFGELLGMFHLLNGRPLEILRQRTVPLVLADEVEIHVLQRCRVLLRERIVQQFDAALILFFVCHSL